MSKHLIDLQHISKSYDGQMVLDDLNLYIRENEFLTLLGPSGCGKTTTLRLIGGFETPDQGRIIFDGKDITSLPPNKRQLNTVFQKYALFPHMTIAENIAFGLKIKKKSDAYIQDKIKYALKLVNLDGFENRNPDSLSGGQQQRIAIARAIVNEPKVLLLDEPLGALDLKLRQDMQYELIRLKNELGITFIYVTHDQEEALDDVRYHRGHEPGLHSADRHSCAISTMSRKMPSSPTLSETATSSTASCWRISWWRSSASDLRCVDTGFGKNRPVDVVIRPEDIDLVKPEEGIIDGVVTHLIFKGVHYEMEVHGQWLRVAGTQHRLCSRWAPRWASHVDPFDIQIMNKPESEDEEAVPNIEN